MTSIARYRLAPIGITLLASLLLIVLSLARQRSIAWEQRICASEQKYRLLFQEMQIGFALHEILRDAAGQPYESRFIEVNSAFERLTGLHKDALIGKTVREVLPALARSWIKACEQVAVTARSKHFEYYAKDRNKYYEVLAYCPKLGQFAVIFTDITERKQTEEALKESESKFRLLFERSPDAALLMDGEAFIDCNPAALAMMNCSHKDQLLALHPSQLSPQTQPDGRLSSEKADEMIKTAFAKGHWQFEWVHRKANGEDFPVEVTVTSVPLGGRPVLYTVWRDSSERKRAEERIRHLAYFDALTGLPNRALLHDRVSQALAAADREHKELALLFIDLDHFKNINDSLGHSIGDLLLQMVAQRLQTAVRRTDTVARASGDETVARLGGDEFVIVLPGAGIEGAAHAVSRILFSIADPYHLSDHELTISSSIGISVYPDDARDFESLMKHADTAMYRAKHSGRNTYQFFTEEMNTAALERLMLENSLRQALERKEFVLYYQPQVDITSQRIIGAEALIRWRHPQLGMVSPAKFIPVAEESGLIVPIGEWVLAQACRQNRQWQAAGLPELTVAVNLSAVQFKQQRFQDTIARILQDTGLDASCLELELTEGSVMQDAEATVQTLWQLHDMGLQLAIDDFGTGYSSLSYLKRFPITKLKIDRSFVRDITRNSDDRAIASAVISMGHSLRLKIIAEGVETQEQLNMLRDQGCDEVQGYYFSPPVPAEEFAELLQEDETPYFRRRASA